MPLYPGTRQTCFVLFSLFYLFFLPPILRSGKREGNLWQQQQKIVCISSWCLRREKLARERESSKRKRGSVCIDRGRAGCFREGTNEEEHTAERNVSKPLLCVCCIARKPISTTRLNPATGHDWAPPLSPTDRCGTDPRIHTHRPYPNRKSRCVVSKAILRLDSVCVCQHPNETRFGRKLAVTNLASCVLLMMDKFGMQMLLLLLVVVVWPSPNTCCPTRSRIDGQ